MRTFGRRLALGVLVAIAVGAAAGGTVLACDIGIEAADPGKPVIAGDTRTLSVTVRQTHRQCLVPIEETAISLTGAVLESQTPWRETDSGVHQSELTVRFAEPGTATVEVLRECSKGGGEATWEVEVAPAVAVAAPEVTPSPPPSTATPTPPPPTANPTAPEPTAAPTTEATAATTDAPSATTAWAETAQTTSATPTAAMPPAAARATATVTCPQSLYQGLC